MIEKAFEFQFNYFMLQNIKIYPAITCLRKVFKNIVCTAINTQTNKMKKFPLQN